MITAEETIIDLEDQILFIQRRIFLFRNGGLHHWVPVYKEHKRKAKELLEQWKIHLKK